MVAVVVDLAPWMSWISTLGAGCATVRAMVVEAAPPCWSLTMRGSERVAVAFEVTVAVKEKVLPLPVKAWALLPPMSERSAVTAIPVLAGGAGVRVTVRTVVWPAMTEAGLARPVALRVPELRGLGGETAEKSAALLLVS